MATAYARSLCRIIPQYARIEQRETFGTTDDVYEAAHAELELHNYQNVWALLSELLGQDWFSRWRATPGHAHATNSNRAALLDKLYNTKQLDKWERELFKAAIAHPHDYTLRKCDLLMALVKVFSYHQAGPVVKPTPAPAPKPLPTAKEVEAERKRLAAERAAFSSRGDDFALPHWQAHHRALAAIGLCG